MAPARRVLPKLRGVVSSCTDVETLLAGITSASFNNDPQMRNVHLSFEVYFNNINALGEYEKLN